jgi:hypothetical protein
MTVRIYSSELSGLRDVCMSNAGIFPSLLRPLRPLPFRLLTKCHSSLSASTWSPKCSKFAGISLWGGAHLPHLCLGRLQSLTTEPSSCRKSHTGRRMRGAPLARGRDDFLETTCRGSSEESACRTAASVVCLRCPIRRHRYRCWQKTSGNYV